jgi:hypothetical protein
VRCGKIAMPFAMSGALAKAGKPFGLLVFSPAKSLE